MLHVAHARLGEVEQKSPHNVKRPARNVCGRACFDIWELDTGRRQLPDIGLSKLRLTDLDNGRDKNPLRVVKPPVLGIEPQQGKNLFDDGQEFAPMRIPRPASKDSLQPRPVSTIK